MIESDVLCVIHVCLQNTEDVSLSRESAKEATISPNAETQMTPGTSDLLTHVNKCPGAVWRPAFSAHCTTAELAKGLQGAHRAYF